MNKDVTAFDIAKEAAAALSSLKANKVRIMDVSKVSSFADYFVIASSESHVHMRALSDRVRETLSGLGLKTNHSEGLDSSSWVLLDYFEIVVHIFSEEGRDYYGLEHLWGDADIFSIDDSNEVTSIVV